MNNYIHFAGPSASPLRLIIHSILLLSTCFVQSPQQHRVYTEKEIVALAAKAGVRNADDINAQLVDDGEVDKAKIGGSNYFWSFPGKKDRLVQLKHEENVRAIAATKTKIEEAESKLADAKRGREDEDGERPKKLARLTELAKERKAAEEELDKLKENDPQALADLEQELKFVYQAAERWTDNIFECKTYLTKKRGMSSKEACRLLGISDAFDCKLAYLFICSYFVCVHCFHHWSPNIWNPCSSLVPPLFQYCRPRQAQLEAVCLPVLAPVLGTGNYTSSGQHAYT